MKRIILMMAVAATAFTACGKKVEPPQPYGPVPTPQQMEWQKMEYYMFIHFGPNTFTNVEWGNGKEDPQVFAPTGEVDCRQWAATAKAAGMKAIILTAKHHDGFCLWPSQYSTHTVRESAWKDGQGDLLKELSEACAEYGLKFGVYLSPWDQNHPTYGTPVYNEVFVNTLSEVLTNYGPVFEQWFDGANGEGHGGKKQVYDWNLFNGTVAKLQPDAVIFSDVGPGCRWIGNERGIAGQTNWSRIDTAGHEPGLKAPSSRILNTGLPEGEAWIPGEADVSIRPGWFYSPETDDKVKTVDQLMNIYYSSVGRNANLLLNVPPARNGRIHPTDSTRLMEFRDAVAESFKNELTAGAKISASALRGGSSKYAASNMLNNDYDSYWTTDDSITMASITLTLDKPQEFNRLKIQEYLPLGQRVSEFNVEYYDSEADEWVELAQATTIGYKRILQFPVVVASQVRINITGAYACPVLNRVALYNAPDSFGEHTEEFVPLSSPGVGYAIVSPNSSEVMKMFDNDPTTIATLDAKSEIIIKLSDTYNIKGFGYIPEANVDAPNISRYTAYTSKNGLHWELLSEEKALFDNMKNNPVRQNVTFKTAKQGGFFKLRIDELTNPGDTYRIAEFGIVVE